MSTIYTGSNYGIISTANSGSGSLSASGDTTGSSFSYENVQNYTTGTIFVNLSSGGYATLTINYSNDQTGLINSTESYVFTKTGSQTINFAPKGNFLKLVLTANVSGVAYTIQTRYNNTGGNFDLDNGVISSSNSAYLANLDAGVLHEGSYDEIYNYSLITVLVNGLGSSPAAGTINCYFSSDGTNVDRTVSYPVQDCTANSTTTTTSTTFNPAHTLLPISKYFKVDYLNGGVALTDFRLTVLYHKSKSKPLTSRVTQFLTDYVDTDTVRCILNGRTEGTILPGGNYQNLNVSNGALNVKIKEPISAFGELLNTELTPTTQVDFTNGRPLDKIMFYQNYPSYSSYNFTDSKCKITTATGSGSKSVIELKSTTFTKYKPGQGTDIRFTAIFPNGYDVNHDQYAGIFTGGDALTFGYFGGTSEFAIRHVSFGVRQIVRFSNSGTVDAGGTLKLSFDSTVIDVPVVNGDTALVVARKIYNAIIALPALNTYGWTNNYNTINSTTYYNTCIYNISSNTQVSVSVNLNGVTGITFSVSVLRSGVNPEITIIPQSQWNIDTCKDMGSLQQNYVKNRSGFRLDPTKGNVFKIAFQYLGFGSITFYIELSESEVLVPVHRIKYVNTYLKPTLKNPNMQIGIGVAQLINNPGNSISVETSSFASFLQGSQLITSVNRSYGLTLKTNTQTGVNSLTRTSPGVIFGLQSALIYESLNSNASVNYTINNNNIFLSTINVAVNASANTTANIHFLIIKNPTSVITNRSTSASYPNFVEYNENLVNVVDGVAVTDGSTGTVTSGGSIVLEFTIAENQNTSENIQPLGFTISQFDSYYLCFYGDASGNLDISGSISYQINM